MWTDIRLGKDRRTDNRCHTLKNGFELLLLTEYLLDESFSPWAVFAHERRNLQTVATERA